MDLNIFNYKLDQLRIAKYPPKVRGSSRLLVLDRDSNTLVDDRYSNIINYLNEGDVLVINESKVLPARLTLRNKNNLVRELLLLEKHGTDENWFQHKALLRGKVKVNEILYTKNNDEIRVLRLYNNGTVIVESSSNLLDLAFKEGSLPLPPYLNRDSNDNDKERYQTKWAKQIGSVAAPTASLNMTNEMLANIKEKGIKVQKLTLHVGLGTFLPIRTENLTEHKMHREYFEIPLKTINAIREAKSNNKRIFALGTTVTRTLEYAYSEILNESNSQPIKGEADIFIYPGYKFKLIDGLITNFHAPKSTVLMMAAAFAGWDKLKNAYNHATIEKYSFLSYGDSMLIF